MSIKLQVRTLDLLKKIVNGNLNKIATNVYDMIISSPELVTMDKRVLDAIKHINSSENKGI